MDIIDVMLARAMTPQGQTETYVSIANAAAAKAEKAKTDAADAVATVEAAAESIAETQAAATQLLEDAQSALETAQAIQVNTLDVEDVHTEIKKLKVTPNIVEGQQVNTVQIITTYPDNTPSTKNIFKMYKGQGENEDGTMTQKAIKEYVATATENLPNANINFDAEDAGQLVVIGEDGSAIAGGIASDEIIELLIRSNMYNVDGTVGLEIDYANKTFTRIQNAVGLAAGEDFNSYPMYGGRMRCNVAADGTINAFYGDNNYTEDGTNGQVMVYQPKFYYQRIPLVVDGNIIRKESLIISPVKHSGFKLAPAFMNGEDELDYILLSAYEGSISGNKLVSVANAKPASNLTALAAEEKAAANGTGWHISNLAVESLNQMLQIVEFGSMNGQQALEAGICNIEGVANTNCASLTGSTSSLGNATGHADTTINDINGTTSNETEAGKRAISYRGLENPWGNLWRIVGGVIIHGDGGSNGGTPYICTNFNFTPNTLGSNYESVGFNLPSTYSWVSAMGYGNSKYDWVFLPAECSSGANSLLPVGDYLWTVANTSGNRVLAAGGPYNLQEHDGPFYYASDRNVSESSRNNYGARLMFIPSKDNIYTENITKWTTKMGV